MKLSINDIKKIHKIHNEALSEIKEEKCFICGKRCSSFCDSHSIPKFVLKSIAESGFVYSPEATKKASKNELKLLYKAKLGVNEAKIFKNICRECDNSLFNSIENIDSTMKPFSDKEFSLYALKILLHDIFIKKLCCSIDNLHYKELYGRGSIHFNWLADIKDMTNNAKEYIDAVKNKSLIHHKVIIDTILDKKVNFACVTKVLLGNSYKGAKLYNLYDYDASFGFIYIVVLPLKNNRTKVSMFYRRKNKIYNILKNEFDDMDMKEKLQAVSNIIIMHTEDFLCTNSIINGLKRIRKIVAEEVTEFSNDEYLLRIDKLNKSGINLFEM